MEQEREQEMDDQSEEEEEDEVVETSQKQEEGSKKGASSLRNTIDRSTAVTLEYGAILIAKFYQNAHEIIADYDVENSNHDAKHDKLLSLEDYIDREIEGMTKFVRNRLLERRIREEQNGKSSTTSFFNSASSNENENKIEEQWPTLWILEEMKVLFHGPLQQQGNNIDETDNNANESTTSTPLSLSYSTSKPVDTRPFIGNEQNYYSHHNSLIQHIIQSRKGIPISLSVIYAAIFRRLSGGDDMEAVGLPGHFMLSTKINLSSSLNGANEQQQQQVFVDVFHGGAILTKQQCQILIVSRYNIPWDDTFIEPIRKTEVWCRMLRNLVNCHHRKIISSGRDMFLDNIGEPAEFEDSSLDTDTKMMNAVRVLISLGFRLSRLPLDMCNQDESFTEIVMMMSTLSQS